MKNLKWLLVAIYFLFSCDRTEEITPQNEIFALKNGNNWVNKDSSFKVFGGKTKGFAGEQCDFLNTIDFSIVIFNINGDRRESLTFSKVGIKKTSYALFTSNKCDDGLIDARYYTLGEDGDVTTGVYELMKGMDNKLAIDNYDESAKTISGTFSAIFIKIRGVSYEPDTIKFTNGTFKVKLNM